MTIQGKDWREIIETELKRPYRRRLRRAAKVLLVLFVALFAYTAFVMAGFGLGWWE